MKGFITPFPKYPIFCLTFLTYCFYCWYEHVHVNYQFRLSMTYLSNKANKLLDIRSLPILWLRTFSCLLWLTMVDFFHSKVEWIQKLFLYLCSALFCTVLNLYLFWFVFMWCLIFTWFKNLVPVLSGDILWWAYCSFSFFQSLCKNV